MTTTTPRPMAMPSTLPKPHPNEKMKAAQWMGTRTVHLSTVAKPTITDPGDAIVHITHCTIGGADLHLYNGELSDSIHKGDILGHEAIGVVEETGPEVHSLSPGDRVMVLPIIACGKCDYCQRQEYALCDATNPSREMEAAYGHRMASILGYTRLHGGYPGVQAEYCRVPNADMTCAKVPADAEAKKLLGLAHVTTAAWHGCELAGVSNGDIVGVWGCGPVGLSVQRLTMLRGAKKVYAVDKDATRLQIAEGFGMIPVDVSAHPEVGDYLLSMEPKGLDCSIEASGFRSTQKPQHAAMRAIGLEHDSGDTVSAMIKATRKGGHLALIGDFFYNTNDFPIGPLMEKGLTLRGGQVNSQKYHPLLLDLVAQGKYDPSWVFTHEDDFENIAEDYRRFARHEIPGGLKVCLVTEFGRRQSG
ncbi:putative formaldehyde dehydrogenase [Aspergillus clavatus NRRL 1]|uniref:Alcohol dehydrogenase n=1 Tax=Aspergillus clavatus (strain ATCC 1007 / CBS 513.65 / DSM 816 / NCTC 3887 / NRRL 1 / QM 1276 / 107) TaxID=344612 RepID=A1CSC7_ASPCL|nr:alcohol dehydrogenase [Aspergillus clavatus NRRL 1]EAW08548.1 alcohol dehydrogenase [Aspergillus clavatus NRRL 1]